MSVQQLRKELIFDADTLINANCSGDAECLADMLQVVRSCTG